MDHRTDQQSEHRYTLYLESDLNRVFTGSLLEVAAAELRLVSDGIGLAGVGEIERVTEGRAQLLRFAAPVGPEVLAPTIGRLSASAALFRRVEADRSELLEPIPIDESLVYGSELVTTQRYRGKTNERLTRAMLNVALAAAGIDPANPVGTVLDPMCGRGTTLNWALAYGLDGIGIEPDRSSLDHHGAFLETWAKRQRLPHKAQRFRPRNGERRALTMELGPDRAAFKAGRGQRIQTFSADGADRSLAIKAGSVDVVVTDLPYGVQHRETAHAKPEANTAALVARMVPAWHRWLRPGGGLCLAWNTKRLGRRDLSRLLVEAGFSPIVAVGGFSMRHTVDATIDRDVIVATR